MRLAGVERRAIVRRAVAYPSSKRSYFFKPARCADPRAADSVCRAWRRLRGCLGFDSSNKRSKMTVNEKANPRRDADPGHFGEGAFPDSVAAFNDPLYGHVYRHKGNTTEQVRKVIIGLE